MASSLIVINTNSSPRIKSPPPPSSLSQSEQNISNTGIQSANPSSISSRMNTSALPLINEPNNMSNNTSPSIVSIVKRNSLDYSSPNINSNSSVYIADQVKLKFNHKNTILPSLNLVNYDNQKIQEENEISRKNTNNNSDPLKISPSSSCSSSPSHSPTIITTTTELMNESTSSSTNTYTELDFDNNNNNEQNERLQEREIDVKITPNINSNNNNNNDFSFDLNSSAKNSNIYNNSQRKSSYSGEPLSILKSSNTFVPKGPNESNMLNNTISDFRFFNNINNNKNDHNNLDLSIDNSLSLHSSFNAQNGHIVPIIDKTRCMTANPNSNFCFVFFLGMIFFWNLCA
jgi:hypothetical protein